MTLIGIVIVIIGFALKLDTIAVVVSAGVVTGIVANISFIEILEILGSTFVSQRHMSLFILTLPVIGMCERYGLKERAIELISKAKNLSTGKTLTLYLFIREAAAAASVRLGGHAQFIRPLINPMAQGAAVGKYGEIDEKLEDKIKGAAAAMENYGNFFAQNVFMASSGVLLIAGTLTELGYTANTLDIAKASIPVALITFLLVALQNYLLDKSIQREMKKHN
ncbi:MULTISPECIES: DUF969 domain-containing protein [Clostridium]|uniref:DUF969 domain-containing protein n=1 Tax=Clostridium senegalense TaxID=1465809 RepID=A0A6M0H698_9CLOT|nr:MULTISPECIES: DUF969 domain-containing protein [Clostridium]NEU06256.1 DUF969 domain-containing protein [Clostridium senegalense]